MNEKELDALDLQEELAKPTQRPKKSWIIIALGAFFSLTILLVVVFMYSYIDSFSKAADIEKKELFSQVKNGFQTNEIEKDNINILILGIDQIGSHREESLLTDTILISSISSNGKISLISFPRDLWINPLKTKVNALYYYGEKSEGVSGVELASSTMQEISGLSIDHHLILNLGILKQIIDILGNISVEVDEAFIDKKYPRDDVAPDILPIESRYKTISFDKGTQDMGGEKAIEFIRSRQSTNQDENTDNARSKRQQKVLLALIKKTRSKEVILNPELLGKIFYLWQEEVDSSLDLYEITRLAKKLVGNEIYFETISIPVQDASNQGVFFNPPIQKYKQWVYEPHDPSWQELHEFLQKNLN